MRPSIRASWNTAPAYEGNQDCFPSFNQHLDPPGWSSASSWRRTCRTGRVVEVGCGKGVFLNKLMAHPANDSDGVGFDPSYLGSEMPAGRVRFVKDFYD